MRILMSGPVSVSEGQIYVESGEESVAPLDECMGGQSNGLCGAAAQGCLFLIASRILTDVGFTVELHDTAPPVDETWPEIVEASFHPAGPAALACCLGEGYWPLQLDPVSYRVRYCASGLDEDDELARDFDPTVHRYLLQFWPGPPEPDRVVKQTSRTAAYWHEFAREQPPPPTPEEKAEAKRLARAQREREIKQVLLETEKARWGGRSPSQRFRMLGDGAFQMAESMAALDAPLVHALGDTDPVTQRLVARWITRRAFAEAGLADIDWISTALDAMDRGDPLPPQFDEEDKFFNQRVWARLLSDVFDERVPMTLVPHPAGAPDDCLQQTMVFPAIFSAWEADPLAAAVIALRNAAIGFGSHRHSVLFAEIRQAFPVLAAS